MNINGYDISTEPICCTNGGIFYAAKKVDKQHGEYIIKCLFSPKRPSDNANEDIRKQKNEDCDLFFSERKKLLVELRSFGAKLNAPIEFFEYNKCFYEVYYANNIVPLDICYISSLSIPLKELLLKVAAQYLKMLHSKNIIHMDINPRSLPAYINRINGKMICTLISFDSACFENSLLTPGLIFSSDAYMSPELASYKNKDYKYCNKVTTKSDVFSLAIIFHEYWSGQKFIYKGSGDGINGCHLYQAVDNNEEVKMAPEIPRWLGYLLRWMIKKDPNERPTMDEVLEVLRDHSKPFCNMSAKG